MNVIREGPITGTPLPELDAGRRTAGFILWAIGCLIGLVLSLVVFILPELGEPGFFEEALEVWGRSAALAYLPVALYLFVPYLVDRYDPEPWWALAGVFLWGACFAAGVSAFANTQISGSFGSEVSVALSAPVLEELAKGLAIFGMAWFFRREFDGAVDGIVYGTFAAIGFAATENIVYYVHYHDALESVFVLRAVLTPWLHPLFTAMTGIGFGLGREHGGKLARWLFPLAGYLVGVLLHVAWNGLPIALGKRAFTVNLVVGVAMALAFGFIIGVLVIRKGRTIRRFLRDEVAVGLISQEEFRLITRPGGRLRAYFSWRA